MKDLSLYILDIAMNSVRAGAKHIEIRLKEQNAILTLTIQDDGCGMTQEQVERLFDPFYTTRKTRSVGLGVPFLRMLAQQTGGDVSISSKSTTEYADHGTVVTAVFHTDHIDFIPLGDLTETVVTLIQGSPDVDFVYCHNTSYGSVTMDTAQMRSILGEDIPLDSYEVLNFIKSYLQEQYQQL
ncbi:MAG: sensor histidine kinase [Clostridiales bacterium]|jgi:hypothetical protein|nr:sensor histidine kinase [Clostridiales bacterium]